MVRVRIYRLGLFCVAYEDARKNRRFLALKNFPRKDFFNFLCVIYEEQLTVIEYPNQSCCFSSPPPPLVDILADTCLCSTLKCIEAYGHSNKPKGNIRRAL